MSSAVTSSLIEITKELYGVVRLHSKEELGFQLFHERIRQHFLDMYSNDGIKELESSGDIHIPIYNIQPISDELLRRYDINIFFADNGHMRIVD